MKKLLFLVSLLVYNYCSSQVCTLSATATFTNATCNQANGIATALANGGTAPYTYTWSTGVVGANLNNVPGGTYSVQINDNNGCLFTLSVLIPNASGPLVSISGQTNVSCMGGTNGIATTSVSGGTQGSGFPVYNWSNGQNTGTGINLYAGIYTVSVMDAAGCIASASVNITQPLALTVTVAGTSPKCNNSATGSATAITNGGTGPYSYAWTPAPGMGANSSMPSGMSSGNYVLTVTDNNGCAKQGTINLVNPPQMLSSVTTTNTNCFNSCSGSAVATATNAIGTPTFSYYGSGGLISNAQNVSGLCSGSYTMVIVDQNSCTASVLFPINQPSILVSTVSGVNNVSCFGGANGGVTVTPSGGMPGFNYTITPGNITNTTGSFFGLTAQSYTVITNDANNCSAISTVSITQPSVMNASLTGTATCSANSFSMNLMPSGGTQPYSFNWLPGSYTSSSVVVTLTSPVIYTATAIDAKGCTLSKLITAVPQVTATISGTNISCNGLNNGIATIKPLGAAGPISFLWQPSLSTSQTAINLAAGIQTVTMTDANNCTVTQTVLITNPPAIIINSLASTSSNCGQANGSATVVVSGGTGSLSYQWNSNPSYTLPILSNVVGGPYTVTVTDMNGCMASAIASINDIAGPFINSVTSNSISCFGQSTGTASVSAFGVNGLSYLWSYQSQTTSSVNNLPSGVHTCTVTDGANCKTVATVTINQSTPVNATVISFTNPSCNGYANGGATAGANGGTPGYSYSWTPSGQSGSVLNNVSQGTYTVIVKDVNNCPGTNTVLITQPNPLLITTNTVVNVSCNGGSNGGIYTSVSGGNSQYTYSWIPIQPSTATVTNLAPGTYTLIVTDNLGCVTNSIYTVSQPSVLTASTFTSYACAGVNGSATVNISGGTSPYLYNWNTTPTQTNNIAGNLSTGNYIFTVTDINGCVLTKSVSISSATLPIINISSSDPIICTGAPAYLTASGANLYSWSTGNTVPFIIVTPTVTTNYTVTGTDANGCNNTAVITQSVSDCTSLFENSNLDNKIKVYQNPCIDELIMGISGQAPVAFSIYNILGEMVYTARTSITETKINLRDLPGGIYFLRVDNSSEKIKVIKQ